MPPTFDWQEEDDSGWDEFAAPLEHEATPLRRKKRWPVLLLSGIVLLSAGLLAFSQIRDFVEERTDDVEADVFSNYGLVVEAASTSDPELFATLLSSRDRGWTKSQLSLLDNGLIFDRQPMGMVLQTNISPTMLAASISPDLQSAEVVAHHGYTIDVGNGRSESIRLQQSLSFSLAGNRWLLSEPSFDYWGETMTEQGRYLTLTYSERDAVISRRLASELEGTLAAVCGTLRGLSCPPGILMHVHFTNDPMTLIELARPETRLQATRDLSLPTPTLVGLPTDENSYRALYRGYAERVAAALINRVMEWQCCQRAIFYQALLDYQLRQLGLRAWPLTADMYRRALSSHPTAAAMLWERNETLEVLMTTTDWWWSHILVEFLAETGGDTVVSDLQRSLATANNFDDWLGTGGLTAFVLTPTDLAWERFLQQRLSATQNQPPVAWPPQEVAVICSGGQIGETQLAFYDPADHSWSMKISDHEFVGMKKIPGSESVLFIDHLSEPDRLQTLLWRKNHYETVQEGQVFFHNVEGSNPDGRYAMLVGFDLQRRVNVHSLLDTQNCLDETCTLLEIDGKMHWSPDGEATIMTVAYQAETLYLGDKLGRRQVKVGIGKEPFWLSDKIYGYLTNRGDPQVVVASIDSVELTSLITSTDLTGRLSGVSPQDIVITHVMVQPSAPRDLLITAVNRRLNIGYLFQYRQKTEDLQLVYTMENTLDGLAPHSFSQDGRWFVLLDSGERDLQRIWSRNIYLTDLADGSIQTIPIRSYGEDPNIDWSSDGNWLVQLADDYIQLISPAYEYKSLVPLKIDGCRSVAWIDEA